MIAVGARFDGGIDHGAGGIAEFCGVSSGLDAKLLYGIGRGLNHLDRELLQILRPGVIVNAVQQKIVLQFEVPIHAKTVRSGVVGGVKLIYAGLQQRKVRISPAVKGKIVDSLCVDNVSYVSGLGLQQGLGA